MNVHYESNGSIILTMDTVEDQIIFNKLHNAVVNGKLTFQHTGGGVFTAVPNDGMLLGLIDMNILREFKNNNSKLGAVKYVKECTNWGLRESKEYIDSFWYNL
jgi:hypothetical protein